MTAASAKRLGRLIGRIAEERAARGRPTASFRPKVLPTGLAGSDEEPANRGTEAVLVSFDEQPRRPASEYFISRFVYTEAGAQSVYETIQTKFSLEEGVDYPGWVSEYSKTNAPRRKVTKPPKTPKFDVLSAVVNGDDGVGFDAGENLDPGDADDTSDTDE